ncbi:MAG TPA: response regulator [Nitrospiraceae bacterium]|nr:response regulator [Nitrospiraceae bacterium]
MTHRSILIIDDNDQLRALLRQVLEHAGYSVHEASDGQKGLRQFRQSPTALVITDVLMPDGDGLEVTIALRRESPTVKIIVLTGGSEEGDFLKVATLLGAHRAMRKPVAMTDFLHAVQQELQEGAAPNGPGSQGARSN